MFHLKKTKVMKVKTIIGVIVFIVTSLIELFSML